MIGITGIMMIDQETPFYEGKERNLTSAHSIIREGLEVLIEDPVTEESRVKMVEDILSMMISIKSTININP